MWTREEEQKKKRKSPYHSGELPQKKQKSGNGNQGNEEPHQVIDLTAEGKKAVSNIMSPNLIINLIEEEKEAILNITSPDFIIEDPMEEGKEAVSNVTSPNLIIDMIEEEYHSFTPTFTPAGKQGQIIHNESDPNVNKTEEKTQGTPPQIKQYPRIAYTYIKKQPAVGTPRQIKQFPQITYPYKNKQLVVGTQPQINANPASQIKLNPALETKVNPTFQTKVNPATQTKGNPTTKVNRPAFIFANASLPDEMLRVYSAIHTLKEQGHNNVAATYAFRDNKVYYALGHLPNVQGPFTPAVNLMRGLPKESKITKIICSYDPSQMCRVMSTVFESSVEKMKGTKQELPKLSNSQLKQVQNAPIRVENKGLETEAIESGINQKIIKNNLYMHTVPRIYMQALYTFITGAENFTTWNTTGYNIAAMLVGPNGNILGHARNTVRYNNESYHAESTLLIEYIKNFGAVPNGSIIYTTLEPCAMCAAMIKHCCPDAHVIFAQKDNGKGHMDRNILGNSSHYLSEMINQNYRFKPIRLYTASTYDRKNRQANKAEEEQIGIYNPNPQGPEEETLEFETTTELGPHWGDIGGFLENKQHVYKTRQKKGEPGSIVQYLNWSGGGVELIKHVPHGFNRKVEKYAQSKLRLNNPEALKQYLIGWLKKRSSSDLDKAIAALNVKIKIIEHIQKTLNL
jgi:tRNA(Arg) A34 adenosine deaminase TadA